LRAKGLDHLGYQYLQQGRLEAAEVYLIEAYRLRLLGGDPELGLSYPKLGMLRHKQGDLASASTLMDKAVEAASRARNPWPTVGLYHKRALVRRDQGRLEDALSDLRAALGWARRWRAGALPSDSARTAIGVELHQIYLDFLSTAANYHFDDRGDLAGEMFEAAEERRAASLRESLDTRGELSSHLPPEYAEKLAQLRSAEVSLLRAETANAHAAVRNLRQDLSLMETEAGLNLVAGKSPNIITPPGIRTIQELLRPSEALLSIHAGKRESYLWAITAERFAMYKLPGGDALRRASRDFANAVSNSSRDKAVEAGSKLYQDLFTPVEALAASKPDWLVVLDTPLFEAPLAALVVEKTSGRPVYLVERHSIRLLPGAWVLLSEHGPASPDRTFLGIGDSVYNTADARWTSQPPHFRGLQNARLVGSGREIEACARVYGAPRPVLLKGWEISRARIESELAGRPEVLHIAAHVLRTPGPQPSALIHLGLRPSGDAETINPSEIVRLSGSPDLVVLSGCASGAAPAVPGEGLMGLTRAWLINGAAAVAASYWPITDDDGELFLAFYRNLSTHRPARAHSAAAALRASQLDMLRSNGWRSDPRYWAAFFVIGRS
jgi:CHAT domain-containing protein